MPATRTRGFLTASAIAILFLRRMIHRDVNHAVTHAGAERFEIEAGPANLPSRRDLEPATVPRTVELPSRQRSQVQRQRAARTRIPIRHDSIFIVDRAQQHGYAVDLHGL